MGDPAVGSEYEGGRLDVRPALTGPRVAADGARRRLRIQPVEHPELEPEPLDRSPRVLSSIGRERHDLRARGVELRAVLLEVSQLLTTVASPAPPVEEEHGGGAAEAVRYAECAAVYGTPLKLGEALADTKSFHDARPFSPTNIAGLLGTERRPSAAPLAGRQALPGGHCGRGRGDRLQRRLPHRAGADGVPGLKGAAADWIRCASAYQHEYGQSPTATHS
jgi:hypothetical protein